MWEEIAKAIPAYLLSTLKFIGGPLYGWGVGLKLITTILATVSGMMTSVIAFTFFGEWLKSKVFGRFKRKNPKPPNPKLAALWKKYGVEGIAFLTPILLTPIGGTLLAVSSGAPKDKIIFYMFVSASGWTIVITSAIYFFGKEVLPDMIK
jgi:membrane protein DedA with SNARE-associated domain